MWPFKKKEKKEEVQLYEIDWDKMTPLEMRQVIKYLFNYVNGPGFKISEQSAKSLGIEKALKK